MMMIDIKVASMILMILLYIVIQEKQSGKHILTNDCQVILKEVIGRYEEFRPADDKLGNEKQVLTSGGQVRNKR